MRGRFGRNNRSRSVMAKPVSELRMSRHDFRYKDPHPPSQQGRYKSRAILAVQSRQRRAENLSMMVTRFAGDKLCTGVQESLNEVTPRLGEIELPIEHI